MTRQETVKILAILSAVYPDTDKKTDEQLDALIRVWQAVFAGEPFELVQAAVLVHISANTHQYAPVPAVIKQRAIEMTSPKALSESEAWALVAKALRNSIYNADEEWEKLPEICRRLIGSPNQLREWASADDINMGVIQSNFMRSYRTASEQMKHEQAIPIVVRRFIEQIGVTDDKDSISCRGGNDNARCIATADNNGTDTVAVSDERTDS